MSPTAADSAMIDAVVSRAPADANRAAPGSIAYEGPHGPLHGHTDPDSTVVHGSVVGEVEVPLSGDGAGDVLALRLIEGIVIRVGDPGATAQWIRAYRSRAGRSRAARAVTLHSGPQVWLWRACGAPLRREAVLERADGAVIARVSGRGAVSIASSATALEVALAVASVLSGLSAAASGHSAV